MTNSTIVTKYITEIDSVHSKNESMKSLLIGVALILCMAKIVKFFFVLKKVELVQDKPVSRPVRKVMTLVCDKPVSQRRETLVFFVDTPTNQRLIPLEVIHDTPTSRRKLTPEVKSSAYKTFCQEKREYVKNWKEEQIKRHFFGMWHALGAKGYKEWLDNIQRINNK